MERLSGYLVQKLIENEIIKLGDKEIYLYGVQLILNSSFATLGIISLGMLLGKLLLTAVFIIGLMNLRHYAGGYHAKSYVKCFCLSCSSFLASNMVVWIQQHCHLRITFAVLSLICTLYLCVKGTLDSERNPKTQRQLQERKSWTRIYSMLYSLVACFLLWQKPMYFDIATMIVCTQASTALAVLAVQIRKGNTV